MAQQIISPITKEENIWIGSYSNVRFKLLFNSMVENEEYSCLFPKKLVDQELGVNL